MCTQTTNLKLCGSREKDCSYNDASMKVMAVSLITPLCASENGRCIITKGEKNTLI